MSTAARFRTDPRISRRRKIVAKARRRRLGYQIGGALTGALLVWVAGWSPLLKVQHVELEGGSHTTPAEVARAAGLSDQDHLLFVSSADVTARVRALPWVKSVKVDRLLPNTVRIRIEEREPAMVLTTESGSWTLDGSGRVLERGGEGRGLPVLAASGLDAPVPGETITSLSVKAAVRALGSMPDRLSEKVKAAFAPTSERISFALEGGVQVRYGAAEELRDKHEVVLALLDQLRQQGKTAGYIDVRVPSNPALTEQSELTEETVGEPPPGL